MLDAGTNFQIAFICDTGSSKDVASHMQTYWFNGAGPPRQLMCDSAGEFCSEEFARFLQEHDIKATIIPADAHWQLGKCERHGAIPQDMLNKIQVETPIATKDDLERILHQCTAAKNSLSRCKGLSCSSWESPAMCRQVPQMTQSIPQILCQKISVETSKCHNFVGTCRGGNKPE